jgi:hypothetical protein
MSATDFICAMEVPIRAQLCSDASTKSKHKVFRFFWPSCLRGGKGITNAEGPSVTTQIAQYSKNAVQRSSATAHPASRGGSTVY